MRNKTNVILFISIIAVLGIGSFMYAGTPVDREEKFEFAQSPQVTQENGKYIISFTTQGNCDATVAIVDPATDNRIVRHLASGVLGANAPLPFQKGTLAQRIEWDGLDDKGDPAPTGCIVQVSLGIDAKYAGQFADDMFTYSSGILGLACDPSGVLYLFSNGIIRAYNKDGNYVRTLAPHSASVAPENMALYSYVSTTFGDKVVNSKEILNMYSPFTAIPSALVSTASFISGSNRLVYVGMGADYRVKTKLYSLGIDGSMAPKDMVFINSDPQGYLGKGTVHTSLSPNGGTLYLGMGVKPDSSTPYSNKGGQFAHAICRISTDSFGAPKNDMSQHLFLGEFGVPGSDSLHFNQVSGLAVNADGLIYVSDRGNNRIQVFTAAGVFLRSLPVAQPGQLYVHPKTGILYCMTGILDATAKKMTLKISKLSPDGELLASYAVPQPGDWLAIGLDEYAPVFCLDAASNPPAVWIRTCSWWKTLATIIRVEDKGSTFEKVLDLPSVKPELLPWSSIPRIAVDRETEDVYLLAGRASLVRYNGKTCTIDSSWLKAGLNQRFINMESVDVGPDGLIYARYSSGAERYGQFVIRFDRSGTPVSFPDGVDIPEGFAPSIWRTSNAKGIWTGQTAESNTHQKGFDVAANGDIYAYVTGTRGAWLTLRSGGAPEPADAVQQFVTNAALSTDRVDCMLLRVFDKNGKEKVFDALPTNITLLAHGVRVSSDGGILLAGWYTRPTDATLPYGLQSGAMIGTVGTVYKILNPATALPAANFYSVAPSGQPADSNPLNWGEWSFAKKLWVDNLAWTFFGMTSCGSANY